MYPQLVDVSKSYITISDIKQILPVITPYKIR